MSPQFKRLKEGLAKDFEKYHIIYDVYWEERKHPMMSYVECERRLQRRMDLLDEGRQWI